MVQIVLMGGDARMSAAADGFRSENNCVSCGWMEGCSCSKRIKELEKADALILPIPAFDNSQMLQTTHGEGGISWLEIRQQLNPECLVCGGGISTLDWPQKLDFLQNEGFALANAVPIALAEGTKL